MGLLSKLNNTKGEKALTTSTPASWTFVNGSWTMPLDNPKTYVDGYKELPNLYGIISLITQKSSIVPFQVMKVKNQSKANQYKAMMKSIGVKSDYKKIMKVKEQAFEVIEGTELEQLLLNPNEDQAGEEINEWHDGYLLLTGNAYMKFEAPGIGKNGRKPKELFVVPSPCVEPKVTNLKIDNYKVSYYNELIPADMIGHSKYWNPINGTELPINQLIGMSPLLACRNLLKRYGAADIAQGSMFSNMGPAGILTGGKDATLTEEQAKAVQDKFKQYHSGQSKAGSILVTPAELHWTQIGLSPVDLNTIEGKQEILSELCNVYHVPRELFSTTDAKFSNKNEARKQLITDAVIPLVEKRKQTINRQLAPLFGEGLIVEYDYSIFEEMQDDLGQKVEWLSKAWQLTPNEVRQELGYDELPGEEMSKVYITSGLMPINESSLDVEEVDEEEIGGNPN